MLKSATYFSFRPAVVDALPPPPASFWPFSRRIVHFSLLRRVFGPFPRRMGPISLFRRVLAAFSRRFAEGVRCVCGRCVFMRHTFRTGSGLRLSLMQIHCGRCHANIHTFRIAPHYSHKWRGKTKERYPNRGVSGARCLFQMLTEGKEGGGNHLEVLDSERNSHDGDAE